MDLWNQAKFEFLAAKEKEALKEVFMLYQIWYHSLGCNYANDQMARLKQLLFDKVMMFIPDAAELKIDSELGIVDFKAFGKHCVFANGGYVGV